MDIVSADRRGWMGKITIGKTIVWISYTKKGYARGGDIHRGKQFNAVISGQFQVRKLFPEEEVVSNMITGDSIMIPYGIPHVFIAKENSIMIEWHDHELPPYEKKEFYEPYRKMCFA